MSAGPAPVEPVDPFDLPDWLGTDEVTWTAESVLRGEHRVQGCLGDGGGQRLPCDLLAVDEAFPQPVADDATRHAAHQAWRHGQVHLGRRDGRLVLLVPGTCFTADGLLDAVGRLARAVGASPDRYAAHLRIGG